ncbi:sensor histidine kinase [Paenibacillus psychroresistens]|uniref:Sensor histidine kinase n=1 Tax=Paenibacillus psychroresistens TaxID=1778678 RepID=A0A6B8RHN8_9BACL|nr:sensor histidine kinase [Paenibacillus psychroresistens]QGQ94886.1 sensor histidine kinase [Paenibacillus psychroresistens]
MQVMRSLPIIAQILLMPYYFITKSLYRKIWFCFFIMISITVTILGMDTYLQTSSEMKRIAIGNMEQISNQSAATLESYMANVKNVAWDYFGDKNFQQFVKKMGSEPDTYSHYSAKFSQFLSDNPIVDFIMISQLDGYKLSSGGVKSMDFDSSSLEEMAIANDGKGVWLSTYMIDTITGKQVNTLIFAQAIKLININLNSPIVGVLYIRLSPQYLNKWLGNIASEKQGEYALVDSKDGKVMLPANEERLNNQMKEMDSLFAFSYGVSSKYLYGEEQGGKTLFVSNELHNTSWVLVGKVPLRVLLKQVNALAVRTIFIGAICLLGAMIIASVLASRIITPLKQLKKGFVSIEKGNYEISIPVRSRDEIGYFVKHFNRMAQEINMLISKVYESELIKKDAQIKSLQSQINPHFLYNTLGMIDSLAALHEDDRISLISSSLAKMFRYNISAGYMSTLQAEIRQLETYLTVQQIRFADRLSYTIEMEEGLQTILIPKLLLQPLVENSFIHGIDHISVGGEIRIRVISLSDTDAAIIVWNNGPSIEQQKLQALQVMLEQCQQQNYASNSASSIGIFNVQYRIKLVYGNHYGLTIQSEEEQGTTVTVLVKKMGVEEPLYENNDRG